MMTIRVLAGLLVALAVQAGAEAAERATWQATVDPPRPGLPAVTIDLGYAGPYVPAINSPITLHATAAAVPFDGYIGYHFAVKDRQTLDVPVVAAAHLGPRQSWTFHTFATLRRSGTPVVSAREREIVVEWRNGEMQVIAKQNAGIPPWTAFDDELLPLRVSESPADTQALGTAANVQRAADLSTRAEWYAGFASVVVPLATWLDLPQPVRDAIFGSGVFVVFYGTPRPGQAFGDIDRALVPVRFEAKPGTYQVPWPYADRGAANPSSAMSWTAKPGIDFAGSAQCPYIVASKASAWLADERGLTRPLPAITRLATLPRVERIAPLRETFAQRYGSRIAAAVALLVGIAGWVLARRDRFVAAAAVIAVATGTLALERNRIRPAATSRVAAVHARVAPGIGWTMRRIYTWGPSPLAGLPTVHGGMTGAFDVRDCAEVRASGMLPSAGRLHGGDCNAAERWMFRRELAPAEAPRQIAIARFRDLEAKVEAWILTPAPNDHRYVMAGDFVARPDGRMRCDFALPAIGEHQVATLVLTIAVAGGPIELSWANGSIQLPPASRSVIPSQVLHAASGGILTMTVTPLDNLVQPIYRAILEVQEKSS